MYHSIFSALFFVAFLSSTSAAYASLIVSQVGGDPSSGNYAKITPTGGNLSSHTLGDGDIRFWYGSNTANALVRLEKGDARLNGDDNWWDSENYPVFTTGVPTRSSTIWIDFRDVKVYGFSFQMAANKQARGWIEAFADGQRTRLNGINLGPNNSPGFQISNAGGGCQAIDKVRIDPPFVWGVFNMGVDTTGNTCTQVPEPDSVALVAIGLGGLLLIRRKTFLKSVLHRA